MTCGGPSSSPGSHPSNPRLPGSDDRPPVPLFRSPRQPLKPATSSFVTTFTGTVTDFVTFLPSATRTAFCTAILPSSVGCWATDA